LENKQHFFILKTLQLRLKNKYAELKRVRLRRARSEQKVAKLEQRLAVNEVEKKRNSA